MKTCDACGNPKTILAIGGALLCRDCEPTVRAEIDTLRSAGKPVNTLQIARVIFRETHSAGNYLLRDIPKDLWDASKHKAVDRGISLRELLLESLRKEVK